MALKNGRGGFVSQNICRIKLVSWRNGPRLTAIIDADDADKVRVGVWCAVHSDTTIYAETHSQRVGKNHRLLHRLTIGAPIGTAVDHKNGNGLDCRKSNLRLATSMQNAQNQFVADIEEKTSRFKGVCWDAADAAWRASLTLEGRAQRIGLFSKEEDAARAYDDAAVRLFGEFARTNAMMGLYEGDAPIERNFQLSDGPIVKTVLGDGHGHWPAWERNHHPAVRSERRRSGRVKAAKEREQLRSGEKKKKKRKKPPKTIIPREQEVFDRMARRRRESEMRLLDRTMNSNRTTGGDTVSAPVAPIGRAPLS